MSFTRSTESRPCHISSNVATEAAVVVITVPALWESSVRSRLVSGNKPGMVTVQSYTVHTVQLYTRPIEQRRGGKSTTVPSPPVSMLCAKLDSLPNCPCYLNGMGLMAA